MMKKTLLAGLRLIVFMTILTGIVYPLCITGFARIFYDDKAGGSIIEKDGRILGSVLIGQQFDSTIYFHSRPSAVNYQSNPSGGSNLSWTDTRLKELVSNRKKNFLNANSLNDSAKIPLEMLFASGSGIDPHVSPEAALLQVERICKVRNFNSAQRQNLVEVIVKLTEKPQYSLFGKERINVFLLNLELDKIQ